MNKIEKVIAALIFGLLSTLVLHAVLWFILTLSLEEVIYIGWITLFAVVGYLKLFKKEK